jgi:hypothetical protein
MQFAATIHRKVIGAARGRGSSRQAHLEGY